MTIQNLPRWIWVVIVLVIMLVIMALLRFNLAGHIGASGIGFDATQNLVH